MAFDALRMAAKRIATPTDFAVFVLAGIIGGAVDGLATAHGVFSPGIVAGAAASGALSAKQAGQQALAGRQAEKRAKRLIKKMRQTHPDLATSLERDLDLRQQKIMSVADFNQAINAALAEFRK
jgi:hypothetical protein